VEQLTTLAHLLKDSGSSAPAIVAPSPGVVLNYRALAGQVEVLASQFLGAGLKAGDVVALVLPNGLEFLVVFLALTRAGLVAAPVNPADKTAEMQFFIGAGQAKAVIADTDNAAAAETARALALPIWTPRIEPPGVVALAQLARDARRSPDDPHPEDVAVLMYTSGSTGRPKGVPLTHGNVLSSAANIAAHYALNPEDRSLVVMPLFHGHGLIGAALSTLASGGTLIVPPRFSASGFWPLFHEYRATWYTAVPTIHQVLLMRAETDGAPGHGARFIRSCSAALAPSVLADLEKRFGAPVVEAYGMTEASHQVASNPLPPRPQKPGTVGFGTSVEIGIVDESGKHLGLNAAGEVVVRGPSVMKGYLNNPEATSSAFFEGWFRTGDIGVLDKEHYLRLTGRIKDMINRGGEKISPEEIEAVLLEQPAVAEAVVFPISDLKYGEEVSAAVVLKGTAEPEDLKTFCRARLADFKVPKTIWITSALPKNAMGKIDRRHLPPEFKSVSR
jgi:oxalate---CoA ligase